MNGFLVNVASGERTELTPVSMLGRSQECNVIIPDPRVSRRHAMIRRQDDGYWFFDLGSFNGSYLNSARVTAARKLAPGDVLDFADNQYRFEQVGGAFDDGAEDDLGGSTIALIRSTPVIMLVSDVQGFTSLSEKLAPDDLAQVIGSWYGACETIMARHGATVDKFIGDCVLAYWTQVTPEARLSALRAAGEMIESCAETQQSRADLFASIGQNFSAGVALHIGKVAYGGMSQREFTLVGDPVNLTFRLEGLTRDLNQQVIVSGDFVRDWPEARQFCESMGVHQVKGRAQPVEVWKVVKVPA
ncbi:MAG: FHA domain-containing protein [Verrucomicrobiae bacterium]|nr:FHA domain-containing protein [Verrucomicrobiae bacterium]